MADRLTPSPKREDKVVKSRLDTSHLGQWKDVQSHLKSASSGSIPSKRENTATSRSERKQMGDWTFQALFWGCVVAVMWLANQIF